MTRHSRLPARRASGPAGRGGFTLIEALAALVIFSLAVVGIIEGLATAVAYQGELALRQRAAMLAGNIMEEIKCGGDLAEGEESGEFEGEDVAFTWSTAIEESDWPSLMLVTATVAWGREDNPHEVRLTTLMHNPEAEEDAAEQSNETTEPQTGATAN